MSFFLSNKRKTYLLHVCPLIKAVENCVMNAELSTNICIEIETHCNLI